MGSGGLRAGAGRKSGSPNKVTSEIREAFRALVESNLENMKHWLETVAQKSPEKALDIMIQLSEYNIPKLARTEIKHEGEFDNIIRVVYDDSQAQAPASAPAADTE